MTAAIPLRIEADLDVARSVLHTEAAGLHALAAGLTGQFRATRSICWHAPPGRVVVSGMGKSGLVARKIAATLASTGTPALFVHPAEASHGDLGMIVPGDAVLALSNSGETAELADLVAHSRRFGLPLVAITARAGSTLAARRRRRADAAGRGGGLPDGPRPDHLHHHADGARRRDRRRAADPPRLHRGRFPPDPSRRPARHAAAARARPDAHGRRHAARAAGHCRWTARCC